MHRKICKIGNSQGVSIPNELLEKLRLSRGSEVDVKLDEEHSRIIIEPARIKEYPEGINRDFVAQVNDFVKKYRPALKELAKK